MVCFFRWLAAVDVICLLIRSPATGQKDGLSSRIFQLGERLPVGINGYSLRQV